MTRVVDVQNLTAGYLPGVNILNGANLYADKGELIGIIGPIAWIIAGKNRRPKPPKRGKGPIGPDDDPDFLRKL